MKQSTSLLAVAGMIAGLVLFAFASVGLLLIARRYPIPRNVGTIPRSVGTVLTYEVVGTPGQQLAPADMEKLVAAVDRRVNLALRPRAAVRDVGGGRIEVGVYVDEDATRVDRILSAIGTLEFRILATTRKPEYGNYISRAKVLPEKETEVKSEETGDRLGFWVPVQDVKDQERFAADPTLATREVTKPEGREFQVLVVDDPYDVTGEYLIRAKPGVDARFRPAVEFQFNAAGAQRFGSLTGSHQPDVQNDFYYLLGIILDGKLHSAPQIRSAIFGRGIIEGDFTEEEVVDLIGLLNAGPLPMAIKRVE
jgi:SecD/SecF fusion protein